MFEENMDVTPEIVQPEETTKTVDTTTDTAAATEIGSDKPTQTAEQNAQFAEMRRKEQLEKTRSQLAEIQAEKDRIAAENSRLVSTLQNYGYTGSAQEIADALEAKQREVPPEQVKTEREAQENQIETVKAQLRAEYAAKEELIKLQRVNPDIKSLDDLGEDFVAIRFSRDGLGRLIHTPETAYAEYLRQKNPPKPKADASSKEHMIPTGGSAGSTTLKEIPSDMVEFYKESFPKDTPEQLRARYNRVLKRQGE